MMLNEQEIENMLSSSGFGYNKEYIGDSIPKNKLNNAVITMNVPKDEKIVALYDDTLFGSGKDGFCIGCKAVYFRPYCEKPNAIFFDNLPSMDITMSNHTLKVEDNDTVILFKFGNADKIESFLLRIQSKLIEQSMKEELIRKNLNINSILMKQNNGEYDQVTNELDELEQYFIVLTEQEQIEFYKCKVNNLLALSEEKACMEVVNSMKDQKWWGSVSEFNKQVRNQCFILQLKKNKPLYDVLLHSLKSRLDELLRFQNLIDELTIVFETGDYKETLEKLKQVNQNRVNDYPNELSEPYYFILIDCHARLEELTTAKRKFNIYKDKFLSGNNRAKLLNQTIKEVEDKIEERYLEKKREDYKNGLSLVKIFETHNNYKSAYDTLNMLGNDLPTKLIDLRKENEEHKIKLLLELFEYDLAKETLNKMDVAVKKLLVEDWQQIIDSHRRNNMEKQYEYQLGRANLYVKYGNAEKAEQFINKALSIKDTFEARCCEININILNFNYERVDELYSKLVEKQKENVNQADTKESLQVIHHSICQMKDAIRGLLKNALAQGEFGELNKEEYYNFKDMYGCGFKALSVIYGNLPLFFERIKRDSENDQDNCGLSIVFAAAITYSKEIFEQFLKRYMNEKDLFMNDELKTFGTIPLSFGSDIDIQNDFSGFLYRSKHATGDFSNDMSNDEGMNQSDTIMHLFFEQVYHKCRNTACVIFNEKLREKVYSNILSTVSEVQKSVMKEIDSVQTKLSEIKQEYNIRYNKLLEKFIQEDAADVVEEKGEFEKESDYQARLQDYIIENRKELEDNTLEFNKYDFEELDEWLEEQQKIMVEYEEFYKSYYQSLSSLIKLFDIKKEDCMHYFDVSKYELKLSAYDAEDESYSMSCKEAIGKLYIPNNQAKKLKENFAEYTPEIRIEILENEDIGIIVMYYITYEIDGVKYSCELKNSVEYDELTQLILEIDQLIEKFTDEKKEASLTAEEVETKKLTSSNTESVKIMNDVSADDELLDIKMMINEMSYLERADIRDNLSTLGLSPLQGVKIRLYISKQEQAELEQLFETVDKMSKEELISLKQIISARKYSEVVVEEWLKLLDSQIRSM